MTEASESFANGPVSSVLDAEVRTWVRRHGVVFWLDLDGHYSDFVEQKIAERQAGTLPFEIHTFRGSHLELLMAIEDLAAGTEKTQLLIHLPGFNEETISTTPLFELYSAGTRQRKALKTLIMEAAAGQVRPDQIEAFLEGDTLTLAGADAWLKSVIDAEDDAFGRHLRLLKLPALVEGLLGDDDIVRRASSNEGRSAILTRLATATGLPDSWAEKCLSSSRMAPTSEALAFAAVSWALCVEYVHDLKRDPKGDVLIGIRGLPASVVEACGDLAEHLRNHGLKRFHDFYRRTADDTEQRLGDEYEAAQASDLGKIDTFRFEEDRVLDAALNAVEAGNWSMATDWAGAHTEERSFWLRNRPERRSAWQLVSDAARLGACLEAAGPSLGKMPTLEAAVQRYINAGAAADQAHRHLEQRRETLLYSQVAKFEKLRPALDQMRGRWRRWADAWAADFSDLCRREGFLPELRLQQRTLFDDVVRPLVNDHETTVLFVVDALRFELGEELHQALSGTTATTVQLEARLAELPTVTSIGMNALAPVCDKGVLKLEFDSKGAVAGFSTGTFRVHDPKSRTKAMRDRVGGNTCPLLSLAEVLDRAPASLKKSITRAKLVIVHSREIDEAGEKGAGPAVFDTALQKLRTAWRLLRDAGARRFVITADHGFLLLDETAGHVQSHGPHRRHSFSPVAADHAGEVRVALRDLSYETDDLHVMFPETTAVFDTGKTSSRFVHGGNSLQERVIPVLTMLHRSATGGSSLQYVVHASRHEGVGGMHCIGAEVVIGRQKSLEFGAASEIELSVRVPDDQDIQVELCSTRKGAKLVAGVVVARVGEPFELFFRLTGLADARVTAELYHAGTDADVVPCIVRDRFDVSASGKAMAPLTAEEPTPDPSSRQWLQELPEGGIRELFDHLATHGIVTETEAARMLGGARGLRRFSSKLEGLAARVPFAVRVDTVAGVKRYVREGFS
ncbi:MAG: BREX-6 system phosphatase PglZ [Planctomycetota bacterium]|nr:BREX-6 system phosphatase PglZ [Planctomycetota bacterium]